jgi:hypothetical protein
LITAVIGGLIVWLPGGSTGVIGSSLTALLTIAGGVSGLVFGILYRRYIGVLGAGVKRKGSAERKAYDRLRKSLSGGNCAARLYADWLSAFLDAIDRFFGDAGMADRTLFPRAFGLRTPAPLWTAAAFDRCLLLAVIYPIATVGIVWAVSGHVGPAEAALRLQSGLPGWERGIGVAIVGFSALAVVLPNRMKAWWMSFTWYAVAITAAVAGAAVISDLRAIEIASLGGAIIAVLFVGIVTDIVVFGGPDSGYYSRAGTLIIGGNVACASVFAVGGTLAFCGIVGALGILAVAIAIASLGEMAMKHRRYGIFLTLWFPATILACFGAADLLSPLENWDAIGPLLLFVVLLTLINAPFDWASLGLTRALLRRGLELGGWWPYLLAVADALLAAGIIALLALTMVVAVQTFDHLAAQGGGALVLPLDQLLDGIATQPTAPEYWWVYALLLSTMIPSLINLMIGGASVVRGVPGLPSLLLRFIPASKAVASFDRPWLALVLTLQAFVGAFLGFAAQVFLAVVVIFYIMPGIGLGLLDTARDVAAFDLPMRVSQLYRGDPRPGWPASAIHGRLSFDPVRCCTAAP